MTKISQDTAMGIAIVLTCLMILVRERWFLAETNKGRRLVGRFGPTRAMWILRGLLLTFALFGCCLATGVVRPIQWQRAPGTP